MKKEELTAERFKRLLVFRLGDRVYARDDTGRWLLAGSAHRIHDGVVREVIKESVSNFHPLEWTPEPKVTDLIGEDWDWFAARENKHNVIWSFQKQNGHWCTAGMRWTDDDLNRRLRPETIVPIQVPE